MRAKKGKPIERGPYRPLLVVRSGTEEAVEVNCGSCEMVLGTNMGRCLACYARWTDAHLANQFDRIARDWTGPFVDIGQREMAKILEDHGPLLITG